MADAATWKKHVAAWHASGADELDEDTRGRILHHVVGPFACCSAGNASDHMEGRGDLTMASISLQDLQRRLYDEAKAEKTKRFWGLYVHVAKLETLRAAYETAKKHNGAPGIDGVTFAAIEAGGVEAWLGQRRTNWSHAPTGRCGTGASRFLSAGASRSACWGYRQFGTGWSRGRSNSSWSRSSRRISMTGRTAIGPSGGA